MTAVTIAIVTYNPGMLLQTCIDGVAEQTFKDFEVIVYDNASSDGSIERLRCPDQRFRVVLSPQNSGFAASNNRVAEESRAEFFITLNPDAVPEPTWLAELLATAERWPDAESVGSTQLKLDDPKLVDGAGDVWHASGIPWRALEGRPVELLPTGDALTFSACGAAALYRRGSFIKVGGFDERFFCYCEDVDIGFRLQLCGGLIVQSRKAVVRHAGSASSGARSPFTLYHGHRNRVWVFIKNTPAALLPIALPLHLMFNLWFLTVALRQGFLGPLSRAYRDALRGLPAVWRSRRKIQQSRQIKISTLAKRLVWSPGAVAHRGLPATQRWQD